MIHLLRRGDFVGKTRSIRDYVNKHFDRFGRAPYLVGSCNICGRSTVFFCENKTLYRESLFCAECGSTSRYRSIARGILRAIYELGGVRADSLANLASCTCKIELNIYDTQKSFYFDTVAYPIPDLLSRVPWLNIHTSLYRPDQPWGISMGTRCTNQSLERLTFGDVSFNIVITSDVMEHVRVAEKAHKEIRRVLKPGGVYLFTVPHFRERYETEIFIEVVDPDDPSKDKIIREEYHGDANSPDGRTLAYRAYGAMIDDELKSLGLAVDYSKVDYPDMGIMNTELFYCRSI